MNLLIFTILLIVLFKTNNKEISLLTTLELSYLFIYLILITFYLINIISLYYLLFIILLLILLKVINIKKEIVKPRFIISNGIVNFNQLVKSNISLDNLLKKLEEKNIKDISNINFAYINSQNKLIVNNYLDEYPVILMINNKINKTLLNYLNKNELWIENILKEKNIKIKSVFCLLYTNEKIIVIPKHLKI